MNLNELAKKITDKEGKKEQVNIAQTKEILHVLGEILGEIKWKECLKLVGHLRKVSRE